MRRDEKAAIGIIGIIGLGIALYKYKCLISEWFKLGLCANSKIIAVDPVGSDYEEEIE